MIQEFDRELNALGSNKIAVGSLPSKEGLTKLVSDSLIRIIMQSKSLSYVPTDIAYKSIAIDENPIHSYSWDKKKMNKHSASYMIAKYKGEISDIRTKRIEFDSQSCEIWIAPKPFAKGAY